MSKSDGFMEELEEVGEEKQGVRRGRNGVRNYEYNKELWFSNRELWICVSRTGWHEMSGVVVEILGFVEIIVSMSQGRSFIFNRLVVLIS